MEQIESLTVISYREDGTTDRFTPNSMNILYVSAQENLVLRNGMNLYRVTVKFIEEGSATLYINGDDLKRLEQSVGFEGLVEVNDHA
jgi:hypothetical protein